MSSTNTTLTTGEVAKICNVAPRTVSKWFDSGQLRGYRIPGSNGRRIPLPQLIRFMQAHGIPLNGLETGSTRVLIVESNHDFAELLASALTRDAGYETSVAHSAFEAGALAEKLKPQVMFFDVTISGLTGRDSIRALRHLPDLGDAKLIAMTGPTREGMEETLLQQGFDACLAKPFEVTRAVQLIEDQLVVKA